MENELATVDGQITDTRRKLAEVTKRRTVAERLLGKLANVERQLRGASNEAQPDLTELGLRWVDLVKVEIDKTAVDTTIQQTTSDAVRHTSALDLQNDQSLTARQKRLQQSIASLGQQLSAPARAYEDYKAAVRRWEEARNALVGLADQVGTLNHLKATIAGLPSIQERAQALRRDRIEKAREIYKEKETLRNDYGRYYGAVQSFLSQHPIAKSAQFKLTFNVAITEQEFAASFLKLLNQRKVGTFAGLEEGSERLKQLLGGTNFDTIEDTTRFLSTLMRALRQDQRQGKGNIPVELKDQLAQGVSVSDICDFVFGLSYLDPVYNLRWDGKTLEQLSPGERGNLLLIFYLLIDRADIPLVIDQPEANLDNNTVYRTLVPCVKEAKRRRQIVMVTHNPNLAVVCDAEQVICAEIRKDHGNDVRYVSGSIEDPLINRRIIDILEGTRPAFDKRDAKYLPQG
jgi:DNA repair exonuclease SbcCD ATPase subunit